MAFYEEQHDFDPNYLFWGDGENFTYSLHVHRCPEIFCVIEGSVAARVGDKEYLLHEGDAILIWGNSLHSFFTGEHSKHELCVFAPELAGRFFRSHVGEYPTSPVILAEESPLLPRLIHELKSVSDIFAAKGILYLLCSEFDRLLTFRRMSREKQDSSSALLSNILHYVNENYQNDCSLDSIAAGLCYEKTYLSKFFSRNIGITLAEYVLQLRLAKAKTLLLETDTNIIDVAAASGFTSPRTFNRNFAERYGVTPTQFRAGKQNDLHRRREGEKRGIPLVNHHLLAHGHGGEKNG